LKGPHLKSPRKQHNRHVSPLSKTQHRAQLLICAQKAISRRYRWIAACPVERRKKCWLTLASAHLRDKATVSMAIWEIIRLLLAREECILKLLPITQAGEKWGT
jgi:hypothetical protein